MIGAMPQSPHFNGMPSTAREDWARFREDWGSWTPIERIGFAIVMLAVFVCVGLLLLDAAHW